MHCVSRRLPFWFALEKGATYARTKSESVVCNYHLRFDIRPSSDSQYWSLLSSPETSLKQVNRDGTIKIVGKYLPQMENQVDGISFELFIETHTDEFDYSDIPILSFLRVDGGPPQSAVEWIPSGKGHHMDGQKRTHSGVAHSRETVARLAH